MERITVSKRPSLEGMHTSLAYSSFPLKHQLREASFSTYHPPEQPKPLVQQVIEEAEISIFDAERYFNEGQDHKESNKATCHSNVDRAIVKSDISTIPRYSSVSSVDGYARNYRSGSFNATPTASSEASWNSQSGLLSNPPGSIAVSMRNLRLDGKKKNNKGSPGRWFFRRRCPCSGKKSVQIEEKCSEPKITIHSNCNSSAALNLHSKQSSKTEEVSVDKAPREEAEEFEDKDLRNDNGRPKIMKLVTVSSEEEGQVLVGHSADSYSTENHFPTEIGHRVVTSGRPFGDSGGFSFPILNPPPAASSRKLHQESGKQVISIILEDPPRESLEVFRLPDDSVLQRKSMERRGQMSLDRDNNLRSFNALTSPKARKPTLVDDGDDDGDITSDASSDLFEIESFSTQSTMYPMYRRRDSLDELSSFEGRRFLGRRSLDETTITTTPSIAPTEGYEPSEASIDWSVTTAEGFSVANTSISALDYQDIQTDHSKKLVVLNGTKRRGNGGLLMSCICEKAINVGPRPVRNVPDQNNHQRSCAGAPSLPVESGRIQAARLSTMHIPVSRSHSARMSRALTTH